jgi:hypothetical protein
VRRLVLATLALVVVLAAAAPASQAADECKGLQVCIPVVGPWVAIPAPSGQSRSATWELVCPQGIVGGVDARASEKEVAVEFPGRIGSPVNPGITTSRSLVFRGTYAGTLQRRTSYQPSIGCIPPTGGGGRVRASLSAVKPGTPITVRIATLPVIDGLRAHAALRCHAGERLLGSSTSVGLYTDDAPTRAQLGAVKVTRVRRGPRIVVGATRLGLAPSLRVDVQLQAVCAS